MVFFSSKMPNDSEQFYIRIDIEQLKSHYKQLCNTCNLNVFIDLSKAIPEESKRLIAYEKKYPKYFTNKPSVAWNKIVSERLQVEKDFVLRYIISIEEILLEYSTLRGKRNNLNKNVDKFRYHSGEFHPDTVNYFEELLQERFAEYFY